MAEEGEDRSSIGFACPIYGWFTEGFASFDLKDAKALLDEIG
jgi:hypothetical protein